MSGSVRSVPSPELLPLPQVVRPSRAPPPPPPAILSGTVGVSVGLAMSWAGAGVPAAQQPRASFLPRHRLCD